MCGIAGAVSSHRDRNEAAGIVHGVLQEQRHRGPDNTAILETYTTQSLSVLFGHNRLKIIDLSDSANQPMWDATGTYCVVLNGEIYNHVKLRTELSGLGYEFKNRSDTEVLINAFKHWGITSVNRFIGSFAFALINVKEGKLWLVRDRFGKCPLYYTTSGDNLFFSSDPKALALEFGLRPNMEYAVQGIHYWVYETDKDLAPYEKLLALPLSHYIEIDLHKGRNKDQLTPKRYYDLHEAAAAKSEEFSDLRPSIVIENVRDVLEDAIRLRMRADVRIGVALSGGLDSSTIASYLHDLGMKIKAYCFGDPKKDYTEGPLVDYFAKKRGIDVHYIWPKATILKDDLNATIRAQGAPFTSASTMGQNMVYRTARADGVTVLMGGQAGDEVFMGYRKFQLFNLKELLHQRRTGELVMSLIGFSRMLLSEGPRLIDYSQHIYRYKNAPSGGQTIFNVQLKAPAVLNFHPAHESLRDRQVRDITQISLPTLLRYEDRNSYGSGVEGRLPFLDYRLVELGVALKAALKIKNGFGKWIIREITKGRVPDQIRMVRYKKGFDVSMDALFNLGFGNIVRKEISQNSQFLKDHIKNSTVVDQRFSNGSLKNNKMVFAEAMTLLWLIDYEAKLNSHRSTVRAKPHLIARGDVSRAQRVE